MVEDSVYSNNFVDSLFVLFRKRESHCWMRTLEYFMIKLFQIRRRIADNSLNASDGSCYTEFQWLKYIAERKNHLQRVWFSQAMWTMHKESSSLESLCGKTLYAFIWISKAYFDNSRSRRCFSYKCGSLSSSCEQLKRLKMFTFQI